MNISIEYQLLTQLFLIVIIIVAVMAAIHAIITKRNPRSALTWVGFILVWPLFGAIFYYYFGINRISRKVLKRMPLQKRTEVDVRSQAEADKHYSNKHRYHAILHCSDNLGCPPLAFAEISLQANGDSAYRKMLDAIAQAKVSISLYSYIFFYDRIGQRFVEALANAQLRGVRIRILIDAVGSARGKRKLTKALKAKHLPFALFLPVVWRGNSSNLRNHRKLLIIDGKQAFTGGLNIAERYSDYYYKEKSVIDFNCEVTGNIVYHLQEVFVDDWFFTTGEVLGGEVWFVNDIPVNQHRAALTRLVVAGPVYLEERMHWHILNAINVANYRLRIATPYFLPDESIISALCSAALRGVKVDILIPSFIDHKVMNWALTAVMPELLEKGCHILRSHPKFDHSKLLIVDDDYASIGSANWDARSFRLNFELNIGIIDKAFIAELIELFEHKKQHASLVELEAVKKQHLLKKIRNGLARMLTPYL
ncbi:MAG: phospholipase D-like domain-containing protein [Cellvibrionales bacterium]|nr:phospholipase D-like domain-containing protein [Cellvibrionales bacterium]